MSPSYKPPEHTMAQSGGSTHPSPLTNNIAARTSSLAFSCLLFPISCKSTFDLQLFVIQM
jgi:hypothetical protein